MFLHIDAPEAGVQVPGGGALPHETVGQAAIREAFEETGAAGLALGEVIGNKLMPIQESPVPYQVSTYCWLTTTETRDSWDHFVNSHDGDHGMRFRCEFRPSTSAGLDWGFDIFLDRAVKRFKTSHGRVTCAG
ncbi:NUDIX domain-containing protein [Glycomyces sp. L485]|nr:NUDIX domain-containing protein [Glycomyces sp. L485]